MRALCYNKHFTKRKHHKKMYIYKSLSKFNETLRLNRYGKSLSPFFLYREFCNLSGTKLVFQESFTLFLLCYKRG